MQSRYILLLLNGAILSVCAVFVDTERKLLLTSLLLILPLLDKHYRQVELTLNKTNLYQWLITGCFIALLLLTNPEQLNSIAILVFFVALPEEWFFRRYFQQNLYEYFKRNKLSDYSVPRNLAIFSTSLFFALMHLPTQGYIGLTVFLPSLVLGYVYQMKQDLIFVILLHSLFNLFFIAYLQDFLQDFLQHI